MLLVVVLIETTLNAYRQVGNPDVGKIVSEVMSSLRKAN